ncbi:MAG: PAC2 family protein [Candidatus Diapherotrites archaeon]|nr:PAC2 family protein [Candidatus Diapherotrites archaeon]
MVTEIIFSKKPKLRKPILLIGLPGIGLVGKIALDYMLKHLKTEKIAEIYSDSFPPSVHTQNGLIEMIKNELFYLKGSSQDYLFLAGPVQPALNMTGTLNEPHFEFATQIVLMAKDLGVQEIYTLAGINIGDARMEKEPEVIIAATNEKLLKEWKALNIGKGGLISGVAGLVLGIAKRHGIEGACLMGETNVKLIYGDHGAAKILIDLLKKKYNFKVDMNKIKKESKNIEDAFSQLSQQGPPKPRDDEDYEPRGLSYVR